MELCLGSPNSCDPWYAVHCQSRKESFAANALIKEQCAAAFLPQVRRYVRGNVQSQPFFPGYFFVQANLDQVSYSRINSTVGVIRLIEFGGEPERVPQIVIDTIFEEVNRLNTSGYLPAHNFLPGDHVHIKNGPLQDLEMIFVGPTTPGKRVYVLLNILGRLKEVPVDPCMLESSAMPLVQQKRYTRGKGRKIRQFTQP